MKPRLVAALTALLSVSLAASADMATKRLGTPPKGDGAKPPDARTARPKPPTAYVPETTAPPKIDGALEDASWEKAAVLSIARTLDGMNKAGQPTEVRLLRDADNLYVAIRAKEPLMSKIQGSARGKDGEVWSDDSVEIFLGVKNAAAYYHLGVNSFGSLYDGQVKDAAWDSSAKVAAAKAKDEWTAELSIPLAKMSGKDKTNWSANFNRNRYVSGDLEEFAWSPTFSGNSHDTDMFGELVFGQPPEKTTDKPKDGSTSVRPVPAGVEIISAEGGEGIAKFDLSFLPAGAKIIRADLLMYRTSAVDGQLDEARIDIEVYPLFAAADGKAEPKTGGAKPLALRGPWFDRLDATEAARQWASGKTNGGFYVKACPFWLRQATCLDVAYEGKPDNPPPQVTDVKAFHNAGQTFITFRETSDPVAADEINWGPLKLIMDDLDARGQTRYCVYRLDKPITAANLDQAELIAQVKPLSCWNVNGRNIERPIDIAIATKDWINCGQWNPFGSAGVDGDFGRDCPIDRLVIKDGDQPLPRGTGLYVHSPAKAGRSYYAVVTSVNGVQNTADLSEKNSLTAPVDETVGEGEPVLQRELPKMVFFNFPDKRLHYVTWVAPPYVNIPSQYYNWSVGVPDKLGSTGVSPVPSKDTGGTPVLPKDTSPTPVPPVPLELSLPRDGDSYWRTQYRLERDSIVLTPHDFPLRTWWYGYHEACGTLKSFNQGTVQPYTERRLLAFVKWAAKKWPVDTKRMLVTACRGGQSASGALHIGLRHPEVFALVVSGHGAPTYADLAGGGDRGAAAVAQSMAGIWGKIDWKIKTDAGKNVYEEHDMVKLVTSAPPSADLPLVTLTSGNGPSIRAFHKAMLETGRPLLASFEWGGTRYVPISRTGTYPNVIRLDIALDKPMLAFSDPKALESTAKGGMGEFNLGLTWKDIVDKPDRFEVSIAGPAGAYDVTFRRPQNFKPAAGKTYAYVNTGQTSPDRRNPNPSAERNEGEVTVGEDGVLAIKGLKVYPASGRLVITPKGN